MKKVRIIGLPRKGDPLAQRELWRGGTFTVVDVPPDETPSSYVWVDKDEVAEHMEHKGDLGYATFFRKLAETPGGRYSPGLLVEKDVCEFLDS